MLSSNAYLLIISLLIIATLLEPLADKFRVGPISIVLVLTGYIGSEITIGVFDVDTGIRWDNFKAIIFYFILPILIFQSAIEINLRTLLRNFVPILIMAIPLMILSTIVTAVGLYKGIDHATGFPWVAALITGGIIIGNRSSFSCFITKKGQCPGAIANIVGRREFYLMMQQQSFYSVF